MRWRVLASLAILVTGGLIVLAMAYLEHSQAQTLERNVLKVREFRQARLDLNGSVLRLGWVTAQRKDTQMVEERVAIRSALLSLEATLVGFDEAPDAQELVADVRLLLVAFRYRLPRGDASDQDRPAGLVEAYVALEAALSRLDRHSASAVQSLIASQRRQFTLAVVLALGLLAGLGGLVWRDLRRLNQAEAALLESESQWHQMVELMPQLVWRCDVSGNCDFVTRRWATFSGRPVEDFLGDGWLSLLHPDDLDRVAAHWTHVVASGEEMRAEYRLRRHDGVYRWFEALGGKVFDERGQVLMWFGSCTDVTERKDLEIELTRHRDELELEVEQRTVELADAERFVRLVADNVPGRIAYWDHELRCQFVNRAYGAWFNRAASDIIGKTMPEVRGRADFKRFEDRVVAALAGEPQDFELEEISAQREYAINRVQYLPDVRDGKVQGFFVLATNITSHKEAAQQLQLSNAQLAEARDKADSANRAKSSFLSNMSHEIRTPMNAILGLTHMLRRDVQDPVHQERLTKVWNAAHHLLDIINDILDLSKIEAGKLTLEQVDFSLEALLTRTCSMVVDAAREKGLEVVLDASGLPDRLNGDPTRLMQALLNLLSNAVKFTERGSVLLHGELLSQGDDGLEMRFEVRDTGIGISAEQLPQLFMPFSQADDSTTRRWGGTGLGLAITRHIAELMGGGAGGESEPGRGSRFWITVKLQPPLQPEARGLPVLGRLRCLLVDDLLEAREAMAEMLKSLGLRVETAASGAGALTLAETAEAQGDPFGVILLDWAMPGMDGMETARRLGAALTVVPPLVLVSARDQDDLYRLAREAGFAAVMLKPVTPSLLLDQLMRVLQEGGRTQPMARTVEDTEAVVRERFRGARLLLAEDNPVNQEVAVELLQAAGLVVDIAQHGEEAVRMARSGHYDLILMDVQMPYLDGLEATRQLRQTPRLAEVPIIAMTANAFAEDRQACIDAGMNDHLAKPVDPRVLYETLLNWLPERIRVSHPPAAAGPPAPRSAREQLEGIQGLDLEATYQQCAGKPELAVRVLRQFMGHYRGTAARLLAQVQAGGDLAEPRRTLHSLRGAAGVVGALALQQQVRGLEAAIQSGVPAAELLAPTQALCGTLEALIAELSERLEPPPA